MKTKASFPVTAFIRSREDFSLVKTYFSDAYEVRIDQDVLRKIDPSILAGKKWIHQGFETYHFPDDVDLELKAYFEKKNLHSLLLHDKYRKADMQALDAGVLEVLRDAIACSPSTISVPQLPYTPGASRNKINEALAESTAKAFAVLHPTADLILPVIIFYKARISSTTERAKLVKKIQVAANAAQAKKVWIVDASLDDDRGTKSVGEDRIPAIVDLHERLAESLQGTEILGGPYWGVNLVLWVRGLISRPCISLGGGFTYIPRKEGTPRRPNQRVAIPPLKRQAQTIGLQGWLKAAIPLSRRLPEAHANLVDLQNSLSSITSDLAARRQIVKFYREWIEKLAQLQPSARSLSLYQDLSAAFALGQLLSKVPLPNETKQPGQIAHQLMSRCL